MILAGRRGADPYKTKSKYSQQKKQKNMYSIPSARVLDSRPLCTFSGRADNACTNLLGFLVCYVRSRGMVEISESDKTAYFLLCLLPHTLATHYFLRLTRARGRRFLRGRKALLNDFWYFWSYKSTIKQKLLYVSTAAASRRPTI